MRAVAILAFVAACATSPPPRRPRPLVPGDEVVASGAGRVPGRLLLVGDDVYYTLPAGDGSSWDSLWHARRGRVELVAPHVELELAVDAQAIYYFAADHHDLGVWTESACCQLVRRTHAGQALVLAASAPLLQLTAADGRLLWQEYGHLVAMPALGGPASLVTSLEVPSFVALAGQVYFTSDQGVLRRVPLSGGTPQPIGLDATWIYRAGDAVYSLGMASDRVQRFPLHGPGQPVAGRHGEPVGATARHLYWHDRAAQSISRSGLEGEMPEVVLTGVGFVAAMDGDRLCWSVQRGRRWQLRCRRVD